MDKREARFYCSSNPSFERKGSFLGGFFSRRRLSSTSSDDGMFSAAMQRRGSIDPPEVTSLTQRVQKEIRRPSESNILT